MHQGAVFRPKRPLQVQHPDARLHDQRHGRSLVVLFDLLLGDRWNPNRVRVPAFHGGAKLELHGLRALDLVERQFELLQRLSLVLQNHVDHPPRQPDRFHRSRDLGLVVEHEAVRAVDAGHLHVAVRHVAPQARADAHRVDRDAHLPCLVLGVAGRIVDPVR